MTNIHSMNIDFYKKIKTDYPAFQVTLSNKYLLSDLTLELGVVTNKILSLIILLLQDQPKINAFTLKIYTVEKFLGNHSSRMRELIYNAFRDLSTCERRWYKDDMLIMSIKMIDNLIIDEEKKEITYYISNIAKEAIFDLENTYTSLNWIYTYNMRSKYGQRLFEILSTQLFKYNQRFIVSIEDLKNKLGITNKYKDKYDLKRYVLEPAKQDINLYAPFSFEYTVEKEIILFEFENKTVEQREEILSSLSKNKAIQEMVSSFNELSTYVLQDMKSEAELIELINETKQKSTSEEYKIQLNINEQNRLLENSLKKSSQNDKSTRISEKSTRV